MNERSVTGFERVVHEQSFAGDTRQLANAPVSATWLIAGQKA